MSKSEVLVCQMYSLLVVHLATEGAGEEKSDGRLAAVVVHEARKPTEADYSVVER